MNIWHEYVELQMYKRQTHSENIGFYVEVMVYYNQSK